MSRGKSIMVKIHEKWRTISYGRVGSLQRPKLSIHLSQHVVQEIAWSLGPGGYDTKWLIVIKEDAHITKVVIRREEIVHSPVVVYNVFLRLVTMNCIPTPRVLLWALWILICLLLSSGAIMRTPFVRLWDVGIHRHLDTDKHCGQASTGSSDSWMWWRGRSA